MLWAVVVFAMCGQKTTVQSQPPEAMYVSKVLDKPVLNAHCFVLVIEKMPRARLQLMRRVTAAGKIPSRWRDKTEHVELTETAEGVFECKVQGMLTVVGLGKSDAVIHVAESPAVELKRVLLSPSPTPLEREPEP